METSLGELIAKRPGSSGAIERGLGDVFQMSNRCEWKPESSGTWSVRIRRARSEGA